MSAPDVCTCCRGYHTALHFYHSGAYKTADLYGQWAKTAMEEAADRIHCIGGRVPLIGDHISIPKEARRMPDIQTPYQ